MNYKKIARRIVADTTTPWGESQDVVKIAPGVNVYSTAGHGGMSVSAGLLKYLTKFTVKQAIRYGSGYWFEEDVDIILPIYELSLNMPGFRQKIMEKMKYSDESMVAEIKRWFPNYKFETTSDDKEKYIKKPSMKTLQINDVVTLTNSSVDGIYLVNEVASNYIIIVNKFLRTFRMKPTQYERMVAKIVRDGKVIWEEN